VIEVVTNDKWKKRVGDYIKKNAYISADLGDMFSYIGFVEDDKILGGFLFSDYDGNNIWVHLALESPLVCTKNRIKYVFEYGFKQIGCNRMTALCRNGYERNERLLSGTGFVKEGVVRKCFKINGEYFDGAIYGMLKEECKWIKE
jgi:hypothetical protein